MKDEAGAEILIGGADLTGQAIRAGLVDEFHLFVVPAVVGSGNQCLPRDVRLDLELLDERRFGSGFVTFAIAQGIEDRIGCGLATEPAC